MPHLCNKKTLETGSVYSPEFICMPFKLILGNFISGIQQGADVILMGGGCGQCRLGYYGDLQSEILKHNGYKANFICLDVGNMTVKEVLSKLSPLAQGKKKLDIVKGIIYAVRTVFLVDRLNMEANLIRCRELAKGKTDQVISQFYIDIQKSKGYKAVKAALRSARKRLRKIEIDRVMKPVRVAIVGEIYTALEPFTNFEMERKLGSMGVEVYNTLSLGHWIMAHFVKNALPFKLKDKPHETGKEFMRTDDIGGHGLETIGNSIISARQRVDGIIHIYPLTCMPEIIAQSTFDEIQNKYKVPIMTLVVDEMTGEAGYMTRIEAFVDMLETRRANRLPATSYWLLASNFWQKLRD